MDKKPNEIQENLIPTSKNTVATYTVLTLTQQLTYLITHQLS